MTSLGRTAHHMINSVALQPLKQPSYKHNEITALKAQESNYETRITQLRGSGNEDSQAMLKSLQGDLSTVEDKLETLKPVTMTKPNKEPAFPPPTDAEMNARFGAAYSVEISSLKMMDGE